MNFNDSLIRHVQCREEIWDPRKPGHKNAATVRRLWEEVASELQVDVETARTRWKTLRDRYTKERKKKPITGQGAEEVVKWSLMPLMDFLRPSVTPRTTVTNFRAPSLLELTGLDDLSAEDDVVIHSSSPEYTDATEDTLALPTVVSASTTQTESSSDTSSGRGRNDCVSTPESWESPSLKRPLASSSRTSSRKRRHHDSTSTPDPLEAVIMERLSAHAQGQRQLTSDEHFFMSVAQDASQLGMSSRISFRQEVLKALQDAFIREEEQRQTRM